MTIPMQRVADLSLTDVTSKPTVLDGAEAVSRAYDFDKHPYLIWMRSQSARLEDFRASQVPYRYFVENFSRGLAAVLSRISNIDERLSTVYPNVVEEHGFGEPPRSHRSTYLGYLQAIGVGDRALEQECPLRVAVAYEGLLGFCLTNPPEMGAAALGIVEYTHIKIATLLAQVIHDRFWGDMDAQCHYRLHADLDVDHALTLFSLCERDWGHAPTRTRIAYSMGLGAQLWWSLFDAMCPAELISASGEDGIRHLFDRSIDRGAKARITWQSPRVPCDLPVTAEVRGGPTLAGRASAINTWGLLLHVDTAPPLDAEMDLAVSLPDRLPPVALTGRVRSRPRDPGAQGICLELTPASEAGRGALKDALHALSRGALGSDAPRERGSGCLAAADASGRNGVVAVP